MPWVENGAQVGGVRLERERDLVAEAARARNGNRVLEHGDGQLFGGALAETGVVIMSTSPESTSSWLVAGAAAAAFMTGSSLGSAAGESACPLKGTLG